MVKDKNGVLKIYDHKTNIFGSYNPDGSYKTYMPPKDGNPVKGYKYYQEVVNKTLKDGGKLINPLPPRNSGGGRGIGFIDPKDPFDEFPDDDISKHLEYFIERKYFSTTEDCDNY